MLHAILIGYDQHDIHGLPTELQTPATTCHTDRRGSTPHAAFSPARSDAFTMTSPDAHCDFHHRGNHRYTLRIAHHLVGDCFVGSGHDFVQNFGGGIEAFVDIRTVFVVIGRPRHAGAD